MVNDKALVLNVLHPLLTNSEREARQHVVQWAENIRRTPNLDSQTEERLIGQKFKNLSYKELANMLRLTPLEETISGQELLKNDRVMMLATLVQNKFTLSDEQIETIRVDLEKLELQELKLLVQRILHFDTLDGLKQWIADHQLLVMV